MSNAVLGAHIVINLECSECGHVWEEENDEKDSVLGVISMSGDYDCPECKPQCEHPDYVIKDGRTHCSNCDEELSL